MRRKGKRRKLKPDILIVCEGKTEEIYFKSIKEEIERSDCAINIIVKETGKSTAVELIEAAQSEITQDDKNDQYWAVFDKNGYTKHEEAFKIAQKRGKKVNIAFSSICFEHWILLHYEQNKTPFPKCKDVIDHLDNPAYYPGYEKPIVTYHNLKDKTERAIKNAAWLRYNMQDELKQNDGKIYKINPYTDVDKLISILISYDREIIWGKIGEFVLFEDLRIKFEKCEEHHNDLSVGIIIENNTSNTYIENNNTKNFYLTDNTGQHFNFILKESVIIANGETKKFELIFPESAASNDAILNFQFKNYVLLVKLEYKDTE